MDTGSIIYITCETVIAVMSIVGNFLVLLAIRRNQKLQTTTNCFIGSLAVADLLVGFLAAPLAVLSFKGLPHDFSGCVLVNSCIVLLTQCSINGLLVIAIDRFIAINYPFTYEKYFTIKFSLVVIVISWTVALIIGLVPIMGWNMGPTEEKFCSFTSVIDLQYMVYFNFLGCVLFPLIVMLVIYAHIFKIVMAQLKQISATQPNVGGDNRKKFARRKLHKEIKAAKSLVIIICLFVVCWFPIHISNCIMLLRGSQTLLSHSFLLAAILLSHANSFINPCLYAYGNSQFKYTIRGFFCRNTVAAADEFTLSHRHYPLNSSVPETIDKQKPVRISVIAKPELID
ncbi:adenosine receptor A2b [Octopus bimaculoides]|uniref:G-protein coupled receptors family 1 profile domain-containing protein n=1 Tax=Octopus bimaculoides TaxID=37653 RepID=A0A0L8H4W7_OCTBM|nr:adenosine receptor A2b [Octopus bimaculoides]|eukprot:XP_014775418.1 PREDICTED: adenosine receptor A2b-like [Octopus bimaculoides]